MSTLSTHVLDMELGVPATGVPVTLFRSEQRVAEAHTDHEGRIRHLAHLEPGMYRIQFDAAAYFASNSRAAPFLQVVSIEFAVDETTPHYHIPLLLSRYACTSYRGS
jgi:5-hydroxyisourate hydrolase